MQASSLSTQASSSATKVSSITTQTSIPKSQTKVKAVTIDSDSELEDVSVE